MESKRRKKSSHFFSFLFLSLISSIILPSASKSTIEPCSGTSSDYCNALVGYTLYADLKVSEVGALFQVDPIAILAANSIDISLPDVNNLILPSGLFLRIPVVCSCSDGIRRSLLTRYKTRPADTLSSISSSIFAGLASPAQISQANSLSSADPDASLDVGLNLVVPLPCTCFNSTDNFLPAIYLSYVVQPEDTVPGIAYSYSTTVTDIMNVNAMGAPIVKPGDILAIPLPACASSFPRYASDFGLLVANGSYAITAGHCIQCSCGPGDLNLYCVPAALSVSCSSMQCKFSNLMIGNVTSQSTSAGCNVTSCSYDGYVNGTILTTLSKTLQPRCPGQHQFPTIIPPPTEATNEPSLAPSQSPVPSQSGGAVPAPTRSIVPGANSIAGASPANGPSGSISAATPLIANPLNLIVSLYFMFIFLGFLL